MDNRKILIKNSLGGIIQFILTSILTLIAVPIFINRLGLEKYGVFALLSIIGSLNLLTNFGLNGALLVYLSKQGKCKESDLDIFITIILMVILVTCITVIILIFNNFIITVIFKIPSIYTSESKPLLIYLLLSNSILLIGQTFTSVLDSMQKIYLTNVYQFVYSLIYWGGVIITVLLGGSLKEIGIIILTSAIIWFILVINKTYHEWGKLTIKGWRQEFKRITKKQVLYGSKLYITGLVGFLFEPISKILISRYIGINSVAVFEVSIKIRSQFNSILSKGLYPLYPYIAHTKDSNELRFNIYDITKKIYILVIPFSIAILYTMSYLTHTWLGVSSNSDITIFSTIFTISYLLFSPTILPIYHYLNAKNLAHKNMTIQLTAVIVNLLVFILLYKPLNIYAILLSNTLAYFASYVLANFYMFSYLKIKLDKIYLLKIIFFTISCLIICFIIKYYINYYNYNLIIYPFTITAYLIIFSRNFSLITNYDIDKYFKNNITNKTLKQIFIKPI